MYKVPLTTDDLMKTALLMVGLPSVPPDSAIHVPGHSIRRVLFVLDADASVVVAAKQMNYDAVIALNHLGVSSLTYPAIIDQHVQQLREAGVSEEDAIQAVQGLKEFHDVEIHGKGIHQADSLAKLLGIALLNVKFPLEQIARVRMLNAIKMHAGEQPSVEKVVESLYTLNEFRDAESPIAVRMGNETDIAEKIVVSCGAGECADVDIIRAYFNAGVTTLIQSRIMYSDLKKIRAYPDQRQLITTGYIPTALLGINPYIAELEKRGLIVDRSDGL